MRIPIVVRSLLIINLVCYLAGLLFPRLVFANGETETLLNVICGLHYFGDGNFHFYQLVTYMFMHAGFSHIFFNMFALWMFGRIMEQTWGPYRFLLYYLACGIGAGLVQEAGQGVGLIASHAMTVGASGAVYGLLLAFGMTYPNERLFIIPFPFPIKAKYFVAFYAAIEIFSGFSAGDGVAHFAHIGGMLFGLLLILYWRKRTARAGFGRRGSWTAGRRDGAGHYDRGEGGFFDRLMGQAGRKKKPHPDMYASYSDSNAADHAYNYRKQQDSKEIDRILDKIRKGGYASLTDDEKLTLFNASKK